jgi:hypothetical protein
MVLTVSFVLSPVTGLFVTVACSFHRQLDASVGASGPHDFAVRRTARSSAALPASTASRTDVRDDREAPLLRRGTTDLPVGASAYFASRLNEQTHLNGFSNSRFWRSYSKATQWISRLMLQIHFCFRPNGGHDRIPTR